MHDLSVQIEGLAGHLWMARLCGKRGCIQLEGLAGSRRRGQVDGAGLDQAAQLRGCLVEGLELGRAAPWGCLCTPTMSS